MPDFSYDWITWAWPMWKRHIPTRSDLRILEIGCFEGRSTCWFLDTYPGSKVVCIDTFEGGLDHKQAGLDLLGLEARFAANTAPYGERVTAWKGRSDRCIRLCWPEQFDVALVDGSHTTPDVLSDIVLTWALLKPGGLLILDDYQWGEDRPTIETPKPAIDAFLTCYAGQYELLEKGYQVLVRRNA